MTKDFKRFYVSRAMSLGATMFLASIGMASANPSTDTFGSDEPNPVVASPQQAKHSIKGVVEDALGPIAGANVVEKGTTNGTITDMDGNFSLEVSPNSILVVSYIGYKEQAIIVSGNAPLNIKMVPDTQALDEVVVVGYGAEKKPLMAGAVSGLKVNHKRDIQYEEEASMALDVEQSQGQMGYEFEIKVPYTIPSDNKPVVAEIGHYELPASYTYQSTPKIDKDAFLIAQVTDWEKLNLLEGEANVYFENTFIGKSIMNVTQQNDTLSFSLGRDKRIMIQRTKENEYTSRKFMGSNQTQSIAWKLSVRNTRPEPVTLTLYDQLPVSRNNNITVTAEEISGGSLDEAKGIITWQITLQPGEQRDLALRYKVKYPKGRNLIIE